MRRRTQCWYSLISDYRVLDCKQSGSPGSLQPGRCPVPLLQGGVSPLPPGQRVRSGFRGATARFPLGSRRATSSRRATRHVSTTTGTSHTSCCADPKLSEHRFARATVSFIDIRNIRGQRPPPTLGSKPQAAFSSILVQVTLLHLVTLTLETRRARPPETEIHQLFNVLTERTHK